MILDDRTGVAGEVGAAAGEARHEFEHGLERCTRRLSGSDAVAGLVDGQVLVPAGHAGTGKLGLERSSVTVEHRKALLPRLALDAAAEAGGPVRLEHVGGHVEGLVDGHAHRCFGGGDFLVKDGVTVCLMGVGRLGRRGSDDRADDDERRRVSDGLGLVEPVLERIEIFPDLAKLKDVPAIRAEAGRSVVTQGQIGLAIDRDVIVVVDHHELAEAEVPSERRRLVTDALREASISGDGEDIVIEQVRAVPGAQLRLGDRHAHGIGHALAERTGRDLDTGGVPDFGVARCRRPPLTEVLRGRRA